MFQLSVADVADFFIYICIVCPAYLFFFNYNLFKILIMNFSALMQNCDAFVLQFFPRSYLIILPHIFLCISNLFFFCHKGESVLMLWSDLIVSLLISRRMFLQPREMGHAGKNKKINKKVKKRKNNLILVCILGSYSFSHKLNDSVSIMTYYFS